MVLVVAVWLAVLAPSADGPAKYSLEPVKGQSYSQIVAEFESPLGSGEKKRQVVEEGVYSMTVVKSLDCRAPRGRMSLIRIDDMKPRYLVLMARDGWVLRLWEEVTLGRVRIYEKAGDVLLEVDAVMDDPRMAGHSVDYEPGKEDRYVQKWRFDAVAMRFYFEDREYHWYRPKAGR